MIASGCEAAVSYSGIAACPEASLPIIDALYALAPFFGAILIAAGIAMAFFGSKFIFIVFGFLVGTISTGAAFLFFYTLVMKNSSPQGFVIALVFASVVIGVAVSYFTYKFAKAWAVALIAAFGGFVVGALIVGALGITKPIAEIALVILGAGLGLFVGKKFNGFVRAVGTSVIGSFMIVRGIGMYAPGYPSEISVLNKAKAGNLNFKSEIYMYFGGFVVLAIGCSIFQWVQYKEHEETKDDDFMTGEDAEEGNTCSCLRI